MVVKWRHCNVVSRHIQEFILVQKAEFNVEQENTSHPSLGITICHTSASLVMTNGGPWDIFPYPTLTDKILIISNVICWIICKYAITHIRHLNLMIVTMHSLLNKYILEEAASRQNLPHNGYNTWWILLTCIWTYVCTYLIASRLKSTLS